jgi:hypothetical protein
MNLIPAGGPARQVGPLCRVIREEDDRYYIAVEVVRNPSNHYGLRQHTKPEKNLYVLKSDALIVGDSVDEELHTRLTNVSDTMLLEFKEMKERHRKEEMAFYAKRNQAYADEISKTVQSSITTGEDQAAYTKPDET